MPDYSGWAPFLHAQDVEERWLFVGLFVVYIRVAEYLMQGELWMLIIFARRRFSITNVSGGGAGVLQDCVDAFTVVILHDHSLSAFCGPLPHVKLFKFPFYKAAPPQRLVWELSLLVLPPFPFTGQGRCTDRVVYEDGVQFPESLPSP